MSEHPIKLPIPKNSTKNLTDGLLVTINNKRYLLKSYDGDDYGDCDPPWIKNKQIRISTKNSNYEMLYALIHEMLHAADWSKDESWIEETSKDIARVLWKLGFRGTKYDEQNDKIRGSAGKRKIRKEPAPKTSKRTKKKSCNIRSCGRSPKSEAAPPLKTITNVKDSERIKKEQKVRTSGNAPVRHARRRNCDLRANKRDRRLRLQNCVHQSREVCKRGN